jgi:DNA polymerase III alpha subunit (gram-positive type)
MSAIYSWSYLGFDINILGSNFTETHIKLSETTVLDTCASCRFTPTSWWSLAEDLNCQTLTELCNYLFHVPFLKHNATADRATTSVFFELIRSIYQEKSWMFLQIISRILMKKIHQTIQLIG